MRQSDLRIGIRRVAVILDLIPNLISCAAQLALLFCLSGSNVIFGQAQAPVQSAGASTHQVPLPLLYRHFLAYQNHLDRVGVALDKQGKDGSEFRDYFQRKLGFTDTEFAPIRETALRLESELNDQDAKAKAVIDSVRAQHPQIISKPTDLPPVPQELAQLQQERDGIISREIAQLDSTLGAQHAAKLQALIQNEFAPHVQMVHTPPPGLPGPRTKPLPPFPPEVH